MGPALKLDYTYRYLRPSQMTDSASQRGLHLATFGGAGAAQVEHPFFFDGEVHAPHVVAAMLLALAKVVSTRFWMPQFPALFDPVVTSSKELLRFEGFSSCCGVYARADFEALSFDADIIGRGTTNVDFNAPMRAALAQVRPSDTVRLAVGADAVHFIRAEQSVVEKKVKLPIRWIKGFTEVQAYLPRLQPRFTIPAVDAVRFLRAIPRGGNPTQASWVTTLGRGLRLSQRETKDAIRITGPERIRILEPMLMHAKEQPHRQPQQPRHQRIAPAPAPAPFERAHWPGQDWLAIPEAA